MPNRHMMSHAHIQMHIPTHHLQAAGLLFNIPQLPPAVKGVVEQPLRYKTQASFLKQDVWLRPPSPQINNPQNLIFWRQGGSTPVTLFPHPVSWSTWGPGGVWAGSGAAVETWGPMPGNGNKGEGEKKIKGGKERERERYWGEGIWGGGQKVGPCTVHPTVAHFSLA